MSLETQRSAWKERFDAQNEHAKYNSGKTFEDLKRTEAWFDTVAWTESFPVARPSYPSDTYFLEQENVRLRAAISGKFAEAERDAQKAASLRILIESYDRNVSRMQTLGFKAKEQEYVEMIREAMAELKTLEQAEQRYMALKKYDPKSTTLYRGNVKKLWKENQELERLQKGIQKRLKINCVVCKSIEAQYIWDRKYPVCSQNCANKWRVGF